MEQSLTLVDQCNEKLRFGAAGVKRTLMAPVKIGEDGIKDFASVWCKEAEVYIIRLGKDKRKYTITLASWKSDDEDEPQTEEVFDAPDRDKAITKFLKLCKRNPLYADAPS